MNSRWHRLALLMVALSMTMPLLAQGLSFGVKGGFDINEMQFNGEALRTSNRAGFFAGPTFLIETPILGLAVDVSAFYHQRDLKVDDKDIRQKSLLVPANARLGISIGDLLGIFMSAGPQFSFNMGNSTFYWEDLEGYRKHFTLQETTLSINLGVGVIFDKHLEGAVYYNIPIGKTADFTWDTLQHQLEDQTMHRAKSKTNAWRISLSYYF